MLRFCYTIKPICYRISRFLDFEDFFFDFNGVFVRNYLFSINASIHFSELGPDDERIRDWERSAPRVGLDVLLRGGRRQLVTSVGPWRAYLRALRDEVHAQVCREGFDPGALLAAVRAAPEARRVMRRFVHHARALARGDGTASVHD